MATIRRPACRLGRPLLGDGRGAGVQPRERFCRVTLEEMGNSGAEILRSLGVTLSSVNRFAVSPDLLDLKKCLNALQTYAPLSSGCAGRERPVGEPREYPANRLQGWETHATCEKAFNHARPDLRADDVNTHS